MTIHDNHHFKGLGYIVECDDCGDEESIDVEGFGECVRAIKDMGWKITKRDNDWVHLCPACKGS